MKRHFASLGYGLCPRERTNEQRARDAAIARLWVLPTDELARRIEDAVEKGDVMNAIQYARMMDRRAEFVRRAAGGAADAAAHDERERRDDAA